MRQRVRIDGIGLAGENRCGTANDLAHRNVKQENRSLEDVEADNLLYQIAATHGDVEARHHQDDEHPVVVVAENEIEVEDDFRHHHSSSLMGGLWQAKAMKIDIITDATVRPTPNSTTMMPHSCPCFGSCESTL